MPIEAIIFDFDGTIIDTESADFQAWKAVFDRHGVALTLDLWRQRVGKVVHNGAQGVFMPERYFEQVTGYPLSLEELRAQEAHYLELCRNLSLLPGVRELLDAAKAARLGLGLASNSDRAWVEHWARWHGVWDYFRCVFTRDDVPHAKPAPDMYLSAAACLGVPPERCIAIEDSPTGMQAVIAAGIRCVAVPNWLTAHLELPEGVALKLNSLAELPFEALLARFNSPDGE
ncbi:MAG: haloacid dehalogenase [Candidatus Thermofonsia Clade 1 bacterium]|uniref:Haloacid dehalogenase n=1 Tax=Candidatus Thermofonsia Clade 1 bacterium TaxID=2364210 RepID=A0A2M8PI54_9CHLR|nr:MAG: haloacid dehalogenase [Candidatus Thermofonsia Clade 1 bacterium]